MLGWFNLFLYCTEPFQLCKTNLGGDGGRKALNCVSAFCFEETQPHVVYNKSSFKQGMLGEGGMFCFCWLCKLILWGNCLGKAESPLLCTSLPSDLADPSWDALSDRLTESWTGQLPAEKLDLNTFKILWWPICGFGSRKKEDEK